MRLSKKGINGCFIKDCRIATVYNTGFASGGVTCKLGALCFYLSSVLVDSFVL